MTIVEEANTTPHQLGNNTLYNAMSNNDRWLTSYRLADEIQFTGGVAATDAAVLQGLFNRAKADGRKEIILPGGNIFMETTSLLTNPDGTTPIRVIGQGEDRTKFAPTSASQCMFWIGNDADTVDDAHRHRTWFLTFEDFSLAANIPGAVAQDNTGVGFNLRNTSDITFKNVTARSMRNGWSFGVGADNTNNVVNTYMHNCGGFSDGPYSGAPSLVPMIRLGSGGVLYIDGSVNRWNASGGHDFIGQDNMSYNWDGLYVYSQHFEHFRKYLVATGKGVVNMEWTGGQMDRADIFFQAEPQCTGGSNRNWLIHDTQILGFSSGGAIGVMTGKGISTATSAIEDITIDNVTFNGLSDSAVYAPHGEIFVKNCKMTDCAQLGISAPSGGALIRVGQGMAQIANNVGRRSAGYPGYAYRNGIQWDGAAMLTRSATGNRFYNYGNAETTGTM